MQFYTKIIAESGILNILADIMISVHLGEIILISTGVEARERGYSSKGSLA